MMKGRFSGWLIVTDLDGTLLKNDKSVSEQNLRAIEHFQEEGGLFAFVTGRIPQGVRSITEVVHPNAPCGHNNGGCIYDHCEGKRLWCRSLPPQAQELALFVEQQLPSVGIVACTHEAVYFHRKNDTAEQFRCHEGFEDVARDICTVEEPLAKILFTESDEQTLFRLMNLLNEHPWAKQVSFVRSDVAYYEMLPQGACKGDLIPRLSELTDVPIERIIAVGDNDNDVSMLRAAGIGIAVSNASAAALQAADRVTVSNEEHAIACIIQELENEGINR